ncbi:MAG: hypothetical protein HY513_02425 [Candidatus Aenigmarchaeota archaeon]|nr:hypothetical protein [Candidatus Aenigmarchaeota archaeon]
MDDDFVKHRLDEIEEENIEFSKHAEDDIVIRGFSKEAVINLLKDTKNIINIKYQQDDKPGKKYKIWIEKSHKYNFVAVINILNGKLRVVTFHLESAKRMKRLKEWLEKK